MIGITLLQRVLERLKEELQQEGKAKHFESLQVFLLNGAASYAEVASSLGVTEGALKVAVHHLRKRYRNLFWAEIANTVAAPEQIEDEIRYLAGVLRGE